MFSKQPDSQYWGTGPELSSIRNAMDSKQAGMFFEAISRRMHGMAFDYSLLEFRSLYHLVTLVDNSTQEAFDIVAIDHLLSGDGYGY